MLAGSREAASEGDHARPPPAMIALSPLVGRGRAESLEAPRRHGQCLASAPMRRWLVVGVVVVAACALIPASAHAREPAPLELASAGLMLVSARGGAARAEPLIYPTMAVRGEGRSWSLDVRSPLPFLFLDALAALVLPRGDNKTLPLTALLNGSREHFRLPVLSAGGRLAVAHAGPHKLDVGVRGEYVLTFFELDGQRHNASLGNVGAEIGYALLPRSQGFALSTGLTAGNGFGNRASWNPFVATTVFGWIAIGERTGLYARQEVGLQRIDYRAPLGFGDAPPPVIDRVAWGTIELGVSTAL